MREIASLHSPMLATRFPMNSPIEFNVLKETSSGARAATLQTRRGLTLTPTFMPVATNAHVRGLIMDEVADTGATICLANTYHLLLRPGVEVFDHVKGIHNFMKWNRGVLTDSGGFQIFSLPGEREITEEGARFRSPFDNHRHMLSPETSIATQQSINSDIMMVLDVCVPSTSDETVTREAMERTHRWASRSLKARDSKPTGQAVFAIVQGGVFKNLRTQSAGFLTEHPFDGFAIGGLAVGESRELLYEMTQFTAPLLPKNKPRYLMGVGTPIDLVESVNAGIDMFDCIIPSKMGQQGYAYTFDGQVRIVRSEYRLSDEPLDAACKCPVCTKYTRGYIRHLAQGNHQLMGRLVGLHNLYHYNALMTRMRNAILENRWEAEYKELKEKLTPEPQKKKPRATGVSKGEFELVTLRSGARAVKHLGNGEVMHPVGPWLESNRLYVDQLKLEEELQVANEEAFRILDVGLGAGTNAIAAIQKAISLGPKRKRQLEIVSLEIDMDAFQLAVEDTEGFPFLVPFKDATATLLDGREYVGHGFTWRVIVGDAKENLDEADGFFDAVFFDPFSPDSNPQLWTVDFLRRIKGKGRISGMTLATYSAATPTRVALLLAGYYVGSGWSTGTKGETTFAATKMRQVSEPLSRRFLERWKRSSSRAPHGEVLDDMMERELLAHPQFAEKGPPKPVVES
jgi:queuine tRNA-ribosyltransferase